MQCRFVYITVLRHHINLGVNFNIAAVIARVPAQAFCKKTCRFLISETFRIFRFRHK